MSAALSNLLAIEQRLAKVIAAGAIQPCFSPIVDARTMHVVGCAVAPSLRRESDEQELPSAILVPLAQRLGMLKELELQVWLGALESLQAWRGQGKDLTLYCRFSRQQFLAPSFCQQLLDDLQGLHIPVSCIDLEVAERSSTDDAEQLIGHMSELRAAGFGIVIGHYGGGASTFSQLLWEPLTDIKINAYMARRVQTQEGASLIEAIVKIASVRHLHTVAAGVENAEMAAMLTLLGVDRLEGVYFGKPMDRQLFETYCYELYSY
jgi:EAL domain-containing protein (putative c-di-GMP-specific phosphodiesterase class I)